MNTKLESMGRMCGLVAVVGCLVGCGATDAGSQGLAEEAAPPVVGEASATEGETGDVGHATQALGAWRAIWSGPQHFALNVGPKWALAQKFPPQEEFFKFCATAVTIVDLNSELALSPPLANQAGCPYMTHGASDDDSAVVAEEKNADILTLGTSGGQIAWVKLADTSGKVTGLVTSGAYVFWTDATGLRRVPKAGGAAVTLFGGSGFQVAAADASNVFFTQYLNGTFSLYRVPPNGGPPTLIRTHAPGFTWLSFDANFFYFVEFGEDVDRIRKLTRSGATLTTVTQSPAPGGDFRYMFPQPSGGCLYWHELREDPNPNFRMIRKNLSNGNVVNTEDHGGHPMYFHVNSQRVMSFGSFGSGTDFSVTLYRGDP